MEYLKSLAQKLGVRGIEFVGYVDPTDYYKKSKIFWMTSLFEGFGLTLVEAQTYGCVPIAYDSFASASDIITNGKNGFLIKNGDRKAFIKATLKLIIDGNLWNQMSQESINNYEKFETKTTVKKWLNLFSSI
jgi:glycosyltransferase involved in cell wall biosynthesis